MAENPPLHYQASSDTSHPQVSTAPPPEVSQCLKNARYLHLATISSTSQGQPQPHVSLMNYTYIARYNDIGPVIIMTTNAQSLKTMNLLSNPRVSLLVHDWVSHRPPTVSQPGVDGRSGSPPASATSSSLASLLLNLNTSALSSISTTIAGEARFLEPGSEEEKWCKEAHLANNTFEGQLSTEAGYFGSPIGRTESRQAVPVGGNGTGGVTATQYVGADDVRVIIVPVRSGRISDFKGGVRDWRVVDEEENYIEQRYQDESRGRQGTLLNGIIA